ncbi:hypothetical protein C4F49_02520 [Sphingobacterium sp. KB22]|uniref:YopX protein domain-containing protein n=2 Tax=Sphingobacterium hungaricum TaxID=2082723 RepID=A0A928UST6_9SPHI|nr:hypothetical protein [Sphingobacterium hungaricum]
MTTINTVLEKCLKPCIQEIETNGLHYDCYEVTPESVGQFTGKTTRSGKEIYGGDKLQKTKDSYWLVKWSDSDCGWKCWQYVFSKDEDGEYTWKQSTAYPLGHSLSGLLTYNYEVIGNIHEEREVNNG